MLTSTHKTYYYVFLPTKADETLINASCVPYQPTRFLVEIRDLMEPPIVDPSNPWCIKKKVTWLDIRDGRLTLTHDEAFNHVFRYWSLSMASLAVFGTHKIDLAVWDHTHWLGPKRYVGHNTYFEKGPNDTYFLRWADIARDLRVNPGDEIGLYWDTESRAFHVKLLRRQN